MNLKKSISSLKLPHLKGTAGIPTAAIAPPKEVLLPMNMHPGQAAVPVVAVGDHVRIGQLVAREEGKNSSPVHASISGTVVSVDDSGVRIESDGKMEKDPAIAPPQVSDLDGFLQAVRESGIVGLGGAAFPLWAKLDAIRHGPIDTVLVNGAECEPYITSDNRTMVECGDDIKNGVALLKKYLGSREFIFGIEENKPDAIAQMRRVFEGDSAVTVMPLKSVYPQGAKQVLLYNATGKVVGEGQRLASLGVIIINVSSLAKMGQYMRDGMPLVEKFVTVDGPAVKKPGNFRVPIGTPIRTVIQQAGGLTAAPGKVLMGGPMMGKPMKSMDNPVIKATNAILVLDERAARPVDATPCIHCGRCVAVCPLGLNPASFARAMELESDGERLDILSRGKVALCMECGCCSYVCPAHRPLADTNHKAKGFVRCQIPKDGSNQKKEGAK